jgi:hypothetical protein
MFHYSNILRTYTPIPEQNKNTNKPDNRLEKMEQTINMKPLIKEYDSICCSDGSSEDLEESQRKDQQIKNK